MQWLWIPVAASSGAFLPCVRHVSGAQSVIVKEVCKNTWPRMLNCPGVPAPQREQGLEYHGGIVATGITLPRCSRRA